MTIFVIEKLIKHIITTTTKTHEAHRPRNGGQLLLFTLTAAKAGEVKLRRIPSYWVSGQVGCPDSLFLLAI